MAIDTTPETLSSMNDPEILRQVNQLRQANNVTSWFYLAREYLLLAVIAGGTIVFYQYRESAGLSWMWNIPVTLLAITMMGAVQQRLATLSHEAAHYMLFRNRLLNELVSELFCMFPIFGTTHRYRVQHLGHHQFPNDPEHDPDWVQLRMSGHRFDFPMTSLGFLWHCVLKQILVPIYPLRYALARASYVVDKGDKTPYHMMRHQSRILVLTGLVHLTSLIGALAALVWLGDLPLLLLVSLVFCLAGLALYALAPTDWLEEYCIKSDLPVRAQKCLRVTFHTFVLTVLAVLTLTTGQPWWFYYLVVWVIPLGTSFAFFMMLRQVVQHGNAGHDRLDNTRIFHVHWLTNWVIFPFGNDYHLPHHLFPMVPHYNLRKLHAVLARTQEYRNNATVVEGYFHTSHSKHPAVMDLMTGT